MINHDPLNGDATSTVDTPPAPPREHDTQRQ